jgi:hypothetical protein
LEITLIIQRKLNAKCFQLVMPRYSVRGNIPALRSNHALLSSVWPVIRS